jgi:hypothetical protein
LCSETASGAGSATGYCLASQPMVTLAFKVQIGSDPDSFFVIQTTVSSRKYN